MSLALVTAPVELPVTVAEAKAHCHIYHDEDDALLQGFIVAAVERSQGATWLQYCHAEYELRMCRFPQANYIELPRPPLVSVDAVLYVDEGGVTQALDPALYTVDKATRPGRILLEYGAAWPSTRATYHAVLVQFKAGFSVDGADVPAMAKQSILMTVGHWYENREATVKETLSRVPFGPTALDRQLKFRGVLNIAKEGLTVL